MTRGYGEEVAREIDQEVKSIIDELLCRKQERLLSAYRDVLHKCAELLLEKEKISREEFEALFTAENAEDIKMKLYKIDKNECAIFVKFVHTFRGTHAIILYCKNPPIHYIVFATPHKKQEIPSPKKDSITPAVFFTV